MRLLVDTHVWLWLFLDRKRLWPATLATLAEPDHEIFFSAVSAAEITIKWSLGKLPLPSPPAQYIVDRLAAASHQSLPLQQSHALALQALPWHHKDPFDRMLVAQAQVEGLTVVTADPAFQAYLVPTLRAA